MCVTSRQTITGLQVVDRGESEDGSERPEGGGDARHIERALASVTPRVATLALLRLGEVIEGYERRSGHCLSRADRRFIRLTFLSVLTRECRT